MLWQPLLAILAGNIIYFGIEDFLPGWARHELYQLDWGLAVDFCLCLACYAAVRGIR